MRKLESGGAEPVDLTLWKARAQMRSSFAGSVWREFTEADGISLSDTGDVSLALDAEATQQPAWEGRTVGARDLVITSPDGLEVVRFVEGRVRVMRP